MYSLLSLLCVLSFSNCASEGDAVKSQNLERAEQTMDSLYQNYSAPNTCLLRENYPLDETYTATYLASETQENKPNPYSYLWPFSGTFSAVNAMMEASGNSKYKEMLDKKVLPGLEEYFDSHFEPHRQPCAYASYIGDGQAPTSDRFYDDNIWLGIDFTDVYQMTQEKPYLEKAKMIWQFIASGTDDLLGGGIYWCEQKKESKNACSNAPGSVFALKLFQATQDSTYFVQGQKLYEWTKKNLQDSTDYLYFDNIRLDGKLGKAKYAYNSGQMMQAAALLYQLTDDKQYLTDAQNIAKGCHNYFFMDYTPANGSTFKLIKKGDIWFTAVMLRGFVELYHVDKDKTYLNTFNKCLDFAWQHARDEKGLFNTDFTGDTSDSKKWLLTQAAMVEMYARLASVKD